MELARHGVRAQPRREDRALHARRAMVSRIPRLRLFRRMARRVRSDAQPRRAMSDTRSAYGWVLPSNDRHFAGYLAAAPKVEGRRMYQPQHIQQALDFCHRRRMAVDV